MTDDADERATARVGSILNDKWTLERLVGIGGMAAVYAGLHRNGARAAIKILHPEYARRKDVKERFLREGYAANRVNHSGAVKVLDDDEIEEGPDQGGAFLVMELLEGESIEDRLERGPAISERELLYILRAVLDVLEAAHKGGVIHRDLKPENIFLARDPDNAGAPRKIKILDFGLARIAEGGGRTLAGMAIGTPSYMPPEQAAGRVNEIDARSDLFAIGATCFRILAGRTVHPGSGPIEICAAMARDPAPKLRTVAPDVSTETAAVIDRALAFRRDDRWPNAAAMRKAVDAAIEKLGGEPIPIESGMIEVEEASVVDLPKRKSRAGWLLALVVLALAGVGAKVAWDRGLLSAISPLTGATDSGEAPTAATTASLAPNVDEPEASTDANAGADGSSDSSVAGDSSAGLDAEASDADVEDAIGLGGSESDAEATAAHLGSRDAAADAPHRPKHDAGTHTPTHHRPPHHRKGTTLRR
ncbi:MAG TPA: serine/threonine-protein kinase [Polyangiaceae bacterium]|nr:serine/threonine-protein kinase [Polyangiaceae bacterium]